MENVLNTACVKAFLKHEEPHTHQYRAFLLEDLERVCLDLSDKREVIVLHLFLLPPSSLFSLLSLSSAEQIR